jgi:thermitase
MKGLNLVVWLFLVAGLIIFPGIMNRDSAENNISYNLNKPFDGQSNLTSSDKRLTSLAAYTANSGHFLTNYPDQSIPNDPYYYKQWALIQMRTNELWQSATERSKVVVAILDTGIDRNHEDLEGTVVTEINFTDAPTTDDVYGHGTHIAGIIAGTRNNGIGIAGLASGSRLMNVKVADDKGKVQAAAVTKGIIWAVDNGANVINISLTFKQSSPDLEKAVDYAWSKGAVVVSSAANNNNELICYPAGYKNSISVAVSCEDSSAALLTTQVKNADIAAPGFNIYSTMPGSTYGYKSGTSFAAAHVSGLAALLFSVVADKNGDGLINDDVRAAIESGRQSIESLITAEFPVDSGHSY